MIFLLRPVRAAAILAALLLGVPAAHAQPGAWKPDKNVEIVVGLTAGSSQDRSARAIQSIAQSKALLGVNSTVVNRVGGGGNVAWAYLAQHAGDAHWLQIASPTILTNYIIGTAQFTHTDYTPLALLGNQYIGFAVRADSPLKTVRDLVERLRADPATVSIGTNSLGSYLHIV
jgi:putative tricarboxylic transport membrane protein